MDHGNSIETSGRKNKVKQLKKRIIQIESLKFAQRAQKSNKQKVQTRDKEEYIKKQLRRDLRRNKTLLFYCQ